jgi:hypothetical protein
VSGARVEMKTVRGDSVVNTAELLIPDVAMAPAKKYQICKLLHSIVIIISLLFYKLQ